MGLANLMSLSEAQQTGGLHEAFSDYVPQVQSVRRALLPVTIITCSIFVIATIFQMIACASQEWASLTFGEEIHMGLWIGCNSVDGCYDPLSTNVKILISDQDHSSLRACRACSILCILLLPVATWFFALAHKRTYYWALYGHIVLACWFIFWIVTIVEFTGMEFFDLIAEALSLERNSVFGTGMIMHIIGLVLVITALLVHWGSYFMCFVVDVYDEYGNLIASREDPPAVLEKYMTSHEKSSQAISEATLSLETSTEKASHKPRPS